MKLLYVDAGRSGVLLPLVEIAPIGGVYLPEISRAIIERYSFTQPPNFTPDVVEKNGFVFGMGKLSVDEVGSQAINKLILTRDGVLAECFSTEAAKLVIDDLLPWLVEEFGFRKSVPAPDHLYVASNLVVKFERSLAKLFGGLDAVLKMASSLLQARYGFEKPVTVSRLSVEVDPTTVAGPASSATAFAIERQLNYPFSDNRFWCQAPIHTQDHIRFLEDIERLLAD